MRHRMPRVCTEDIISGRGFKLIHQVIFPGVQHSFFDDAGVDAAAKITQQALTGSCEACAETLQIWTEAYGAEAGNMALRVLPFGGVYVAGGIALKILPKLKDGSFVRAFSDKIQLSNQLAKIPIYLVLNEDAPVLGAAYEAMAHA
jgi:glucokinase